MNKSNEMLKIPKALAVVLGVSFLLRLIALNQSLWLDEGTTAQVALHFSISDIISKFSPQDFHPPTFYIVEKVWTSIFGHSEVALRFPSVIFSLLTGYVVFLIGKTVKDEKTGLWAAVFFLCNPLIMYYSQEARMYMMVLFILSVLFYCFVALQKKNLTVPAKNWLSAGLFMTAFLSFLTFYGSAFFVAAFVLYALYKRDLTKAAVITFGFLAALLLDLPLLLQQLHNSHVVLAQVLNWQEVLGKATLKNFALIFIKFATGRISFFPKILYFSIAAGWSAVLYCIAARGLKKNPLNTFLFFAPLILGVIFSLFTPLLEYFRFLYLLIPLSLILALGSSKNYSKWIVLVGLASWSLAYLCIPQFHREDWRSLAVAIQTSSVYAVPSSMEALKYYRPDLKLNDIRTSSLSGDQIVIIPYTLDIYGFNYQALAAKDGYCLTKTNSVRGLSMEIWSRCQ